MTAAQIRTAALLTEGLPDDAIVRVTELGSEGVVFQRGDKFWDRTWPRWLIARNGVAVSDDGQRRRA